MRRKGGKAAADVATVESDMARRVLADGALLVASGGAGIVTGLRVCAGTGRTLILQRGQAVDVGGSPLRFCAMAGCAVVEVGLADGCGTSELAAALDGAAAGLFIDEPAARREGLLDLPSFLWGCHQAGLPVLVHTRRAPPWISLVDAGADLVSIDLLGTLGQPGGLLVGRQELVERARAERASLPALLAPGDGLAAALQGLGGRVSGAGG